MIPTGLYWNQAELGPGSRENSGLVSILAIEDDLGPVPIGTAFITAAFGDRAVCCTAAHIFTGISRLQTRFAPRPHPTALSEFLPNGRPLDLDRKKLRAMCWEEGKVEFAYFDWAVWDERADLAFFGIHVQDGSDSDFFRSHLLLDPAHPEIGDLVGVLGYYDMKIDSFENTKHQGEWSFSRQLLLRIGRVTAYHPEGHSLVGAPCIQTTIPIFPGMSGAPVMKFVPGETKQSFGVMSCDPDTADKWDRSVSGQSIIPLIRPAIELSPTGQRSTMLRLESGMMAGTKWEADEIT
jgi:hypothetical protein